MSGAGSFMGGMAGGMMMGRNAKDRQRQTDALEKLSNSGGDAAPKERGILGRLGTGGSDGAPQLGANLNPAASGGSGGGPMDATGGNASADWLRYSNEGAIRNKPISNDLINAMSFLPEMGISMNVISGGQEGKGEGKKRTGSTRHDHGGAADADFYIGDRKLDWNNPNDQPIFTQIVQRARANGVTGIGAGDDYMGAGRMHVGFGNAAAWGAGGKGENTPEWLRSAYNTPWEAPQTAAADPDQAAPAGLPAGQRIARSIFGEESVAEQILRSFYKKG